MTRDRKILLALAVVTVGFVAFTQFGGTIPSPSDMSSDAESNVSQAQTLEAEASAAEAAIARKDEFTTELAEARAAVPPAPRLGQLITTLERLAGEHGLLWVFGAPGQNPNLTGGMPMDMKVVGPVTGVNSFLDALQDLPRLVTVDTMTVQTNVTPEGKTDTTTTMSVAFYSTQGDLEGFTEEEAAAIVEEIESERSITAGTEAAPVEEGQ